MSIRPQHQTGHSDLDYTELTMPFARPLYVMSKPIGALCNLSCDYCYYLEKKGLTSGIISQSYAHQMSDHTLERYVRMYIESQSGSEVHFCWHGGEPLLRSIDFYARAVALQAKYAGGRRITNSIQTNGTLLSDEWASFFALHHFLVGISIDGTSDQHDHYRHYRSGEGTHQVVLDGLHLLQAYGVEYNAMAVIHQSNVDDPIGMYEYLKSVGFRYIQFSPLVERTTLPREGGLTLAHQATLPSQAQLTDSSISPHAWGSFLCRLFDHWVAKDVGKVYVQIFDCTLANWVGVPPSNCIFAHECGHAMVMEHSGDVYSCDHYVFPEYRLGNIHSCTLIEMAESKAQQRFGKSKYTDLPTQCRRCAYLFACHGECPKNRFVVDEYGDRGLNYLCSGYYSFFDHVAPYMDYMREQIRRGGAPAEIMSLLATSPHYFDDI